MCSSLDLKNYALLGAKIRGDLEAVQKILEEGASPNFLFSLEPQEADATSKKNHVEIIKILYEHEDCDYDDLFDYIFETSTLEQIHEVFLYMIERNHNFSSAQHIFSRIIRMRSKKLSEFDWLNTLKLLLDHGLLVNEYNDDDLRPDDDYLTPLQLSIEDRRKNFVSKF